MGGDVVTRLLEKGVQELREIVRRKLVTKSEVNAIVKKRRSFEQKLLRGDVVKDAYLKYIQYETTLQFLLRRRAAQMKTHPKNAAKIDGQWRKRVVYLWNRTLRRFPSDEKLWLQFCRHCAKTGSIKAASRAFSRGLALLPHSELLWIASFSWHMDYSSNSREARVIAQTALRMLPNSAEIWFSYFQFELHFLAKVLARRHALGIEQESKVQERPSMNMSDEEEEDGGDEGEAVDKEAEKLANIHNQAEQTHVLDFWHGGVPATVFVQALQEAHCGSSMVRQRYFGRWMDFAVQVPHVPAELLEFIRRTLNKEFENSEFVQASIGRYEFQKMIKDANDDEASKKSAVNKACRHFQACTEKMPTALMYELYIEFIQRYPEHQQDFPSISEIVEHARSNQIVGLNLSTKPNEQGTDESFQNVGDDDDHGHFDHNKHTGNRAEYVVISLDCLQTLPVLCKHSADLEQWQTFLNSYCQDYDSSKNVVPLDAVLVRLRKACVGIHDHDEASRAALEIARAWLEMERKLLSLAVRDSDASFDVYGMQRTFNHICKQTISLDLISTFASQCLENLKAIESEMNQSDQFPATQKEGIRKMTEYFYDKLTTYQKTKSSSAFWAEYIQFANRQGDSQKASILYERALQSVSDAQHFKEVMLLSRYQ